MDYEKPTVGFHYTTCLNVHMQATLDMHSSTSTVYMYIPLVSGLRYVPSWQVTCQTLRGTQCPAVIAATAVVPRPSLLRVSPPPLAGVPEPLSCSPTDQRTLIAVSVALHHSEPVPNL